MVNIYQTSSYATAEWDMSSSILTTYMYTADFQIINNNNV